VPLVKIPPPYRGPTAGAASFDAKGGTVRECLDSTAAAFPGLGARRLDPEGRVHRFVTLFVNGDEIDRSDIDRSVAPDDEIDVVAAVAGG